MTVPLTVVRYVLSTICMQFYQHKHHTNSFLVG
jgi:hypothetical protein